MSHKTFRVHINLDGNQLLNSLAERLAVAPTPSEGRFYYDTALKQLRYYDGTAWVSGGGGGTMTSSDDAVVIDNATDPANPTLTIQDASLAQSGFMSASLFSLLSGATDLATVSTIVKRDANGTINASKVTGLLAPVAGADAATKAYVDSIAGSGMRVVASINCAGDPDYPAADKGDSYYVETSGRIGGASGEAVSVGDFILCTVANTGGTEAVVGNKWIVLQANTEHATDSSFGLVRLADASEIALGVGTSVPTVTQVKAMNDARVMTATLAAGGASFTLVHNFGVHPIIQVLDTVTGDYVTLGVTKVDANTLSITSNVPLAVTHTALLIAVA